jgi:cytidylate kinase
MKSLVVIGGPMGVGRSAVCRELLSRSDKAVWLDGDWCWMMHPWQVTTETEAMVERNIIVLLRNYLSCSAYETVIFDWVLDKELIVHTILSGLQDLEYRVARVSLVCAPEELRARLITDAHSPSILDETVLRLPLYQALEAPCLDTTGLTVSQVVDRVQEMIRARSMHS